MTKLLTSHHLKLLDEAATQSLAQQVARAMPAPSKQGLVVFLSGPLGAGKTSWVRALLRALGHEGRVRSPSFTIMEPYRLNGQAMSHQGESFTAHHFDFYRFNDKEEWRDAGFDELIGAPDTLSLIEWPEMAGQSLHAPDLHFKFVVLPSTDDVEPARVLEIQAFSTVGQDWLSHVLQA